MKIKNKNNLPKGLEKYAGMTLKEINPNLHNLLNSYRNNFAQMMEPTLKIVAEINKTMEAFNKMMEPTFKFSVAINKMLKNIDTLIPPKIRVIFSLKDSLKEQMFVVDFSDEELMKTLIEATEEEKVKKIVEYYSKENWSKLGILVLNWKEKINSDRYRIIISCFNILKNTECYDVIIPTLIAQIDGLIEYIFKIIPDTIKLVKSRTKDEISKNKNIDSEILAEELDEIIGFWDSFFFSSIIFDGLFLNSNKIEKNNFKGEFNLFRHKILHGDIKYLNYGTKSNVIRSFPYFDFVVKILDKIRSKKKLEN